jgi:hypothetical protein
MKTISFGFKSSKYAFVSYSRTKIVSTRRAVVYKLVNNRQPRDEPWGTPNDSFISAKVKPQQDLVFYLKA